MLVRLREQTQVNSIVAVLWNTIAVQNQKEVAKRKENSTSSSIAGEKWCRWSYISSITCVVCKMCFSKVECQRYASCVIWETVSGYSESLSTCKQLVSRMHSQHLFATLRHEKIHISVCLTIVSWCVVELPIKWYIIRTRHCN